jgi:hypothetical protein
VLVFRPILYLVSHQPIAFFISAKSILKTLFFDCFDVQKGICCAIANAVENLGFIGVCAMMLPPYCQLVRLCKVSWAEGTKGLPPIHRKRSDKLANRKPFGYLDMNFT